MFAEGLHTSLWSMLEAGELDAVKSLCPDKNDWTLSLNKHGITPLHVIVQLAMPPSVGAWHLDVPAKALCTMASWLMERGADPNQIASDTATERKWTDKDTFSIAMPQTAAAALVQCDTSML